MSIKEFKTKMAELRKEMREKGKASIVSEVVAFLDAHPTITAIAWAQYAPYFNDGDPCVFRVREFAYTTNPDTSKMFSEFRGWGEGDDDVSLTSYSQNKTLQKAVASLDREISVDEVFEIAFGSDNKVMITRDGTVKVDYVDHD